MERAKVPRDLDDLQVVNVRGTQMRREMEGETANVEPGDETDANAVGSSAWIGLRKTDRWGEDREKKVGPTDDF